LKALKDDRKGKYSIRINERWRNCFEWAAGDIVAAAPLTPARRSVEQGFATGGSAGNQRQCRFFVLTQTRTDGSRNIIGEEMTAKRNSFMMAK
jgi:hypothetical protein